MFDNNNQVISDAVDLKANISDMNNSLTQIVNSVDLKVNQTTYNNDMLLKADKTALALKLD